MTRKTLLQSGVVVGLLATAGGIRWLDTRRKADRFKLDHGHGGIDEAVGNTDARLQATPKDQQLDFLLTLVRSSDVGLRFSAIERIVERDEPAAIDAVHAAIQDNYSRTRQRALENLHRLDPARGIPLLYQGIQDNDVWLRETSAQQLLMLSGRKHIRFPAGIEAALVHGLHDRSVAVRTTSGNALMKLTGNHDTAYRFRMTTPDDAVPALVHRWEAFLTAKGRAFDRSLLPPRIEPTLTDAAPDFAFRTIDGARVSRTGQAGRTTLLHFWGTWCGPCQVELPDLQKVAAALKGRSVDIYGLAVAEEKGEAHLRSWCRDRGVAFPQSLDTDDTRHAFNNVVEVPASVLIDARGRVRYRWEGERDAATFQASVEHVLANA